MLWGNFLHTNRLRLIRWVILWAVLFGLSILAYNRTYDVTQRVLMKTLQVRPAAWILDLSLPDEEIQYTSNSIYCLGTRVQIVRGCDGVEALLLVVTALLAYPMPWRRKLRGLLCGTVLIFSLNIARIVTLFLVALWWPRLMDVAHGLLWQVLMIMAAFLFVLVATRPGDEAGQKG